MRRKAVPWKNVSPEIEQVQFIKSWEQGRESFLELCQAFDISRKTGYKRVQRFKSLGWDGVGDQAGRPIAIPTGRTVAWRSVSSLPASITRPGDRRRWWPGSGTGSLTCPGRPPAPLETYWTGRGWCKDARGDAGRPPGANPLLPRSIPTTCGASTSRAGSALATGSGSIPSQWSMLPPVTSWTGAAPGAGGPPGHGARFQRARSASGHTQRQRPALRQRRFGRTLTLGGLVGQAGDPARADPAGASRTERAVGEAAPDA